MRLFLMWLLAVVITVGAALYQRKTGPTYPKQVDIELNDTVYEVKLVRSLALNERAEVRLRIYDTTITAKLFVKRYMSDEEYSMVDFVYREYPVDSYLMNKVFNINSERGLYASVPVQPAAGKVQYYLEITDSGGTTTLMKDNPVVIRFKGAVPGAVLTPHIIIMFLAMLFSTLAGIMAAFKHPSFRRYALLTLILLTAGGMILGPVVQKYAFGELWTGIPFGWDLTDNKTLIAFVFWIIAVVMNRKKERPFYVLLAALILLLIYSIPHSMFGSELDYETGKVIQGFIFILPENR